jgi:hypothetical protein
MSWDLKRHFRGKTFVALLATAAACATGAQALSPSVASAWLENNCDPVCDGPDGGTPDGGTTGVTDDGGTTDNGGTTGSTGTTGTGTTGTANQGTSDPFQSLGGTNSSPFSSSSTTWKTEAELASVVGINPAQDLLSGTNSPNLPPLDPRYIDRLLARNLLDPRFSQSALYPGDLDVLERNCNHLSSMIGDLQDKRDTLGDTISRLENEASSNVIDPFRNALSSTRDKLKSRNIEYHVLYCNSVISMDGRD